MPLIVTYGIRGGSGASFIASQLAIGLNALGINTTLTSGCPLQSIGLHFGVELSRELPELFYGDHIQQAATLQGKVGLYDIAGALDQPNFVNFLLRSGFGDAGDQVLIIDLPLHRVQGLTALMDAACLHICTITPSPEGIATLPAVYAQALTNHPEKTRYILNMIDESRRLSRQITKFLEEMLGDRILAKVRRDEAVVEALSMRQMLARHAPQSGALADVRAMSHRVGALLTGLLDGGHAPHAGDDAWHD